ncbi:MAG: amidohydrolase family protein [Syntrophobacteraceae bacterium]
MPERGTTITLHRAAWVIPVERPPICNGAVAVEAGTIVAVGTYRELRNRLPQRPHVRDHGDAALMPAVVNAHTHLELTLMEGKVPLPQTGFPSWIEQVFRHRASLDGPALLKGMRKGLAMLESAGTCLCGDITNHSTTLDGQGMQSGRRQPFLELIGFDCDSLTAALQSTAIGVDTTTVIERDGVSLAAHATYSTSAAVIRQAKEWCRSRGRVFSIHTAEHEQELELLQTGTGYCRELLQTVGRWVDGWIPPARSPVAYLDSLGVLDERTLLVHAVHMTESDWDIVDRRGCAVCFCPRSNHFLSTGKADVELSIQMGVPVALGTDSLASNVDLNLFSEAAFFLDQHPGVPPDAGLSMMTLGGARALGCQDRFGGLTVGKAAAMIAIPVEAGATTAQLSTMIIHKGKEGAVAWALGPENA